MRAFDDNDFPLAYLITFRCYGTWLHGDDRGSYRRTHGVISGVSRIPVRPGLKKAETTQLKHPPVTLDLKRRAVVEKAVREVCLHRNYRLRAINVRSNHIHAIVSALPSNLMQPGHYDVGVFCLLVIKPLGAAWQYDLSLERARCGEGGGVRV